MPAVPSSPQAGAQQERPTWRKRVRVSESTEAARVLQARWCAHAAAWWGWGQAPWAWGRALLPAA